MASNPSWRPGDDAADALTILKEQYPRLSKRQIVDEAVLEKAARDCSIAAEKLEKWKVKQR